MKLLILYNKISGRNKYYKKLDYIKDKLTSKYDQIDIIYDDLLEALKNNSYDTLLIIGGDGTINHSVNIIASLNIKIRLAFIPNGTCNDLSRTYGYKNLKKSLEIILNDNYIKRDLYKINDKYFLYGFSIGGITRIANNENRKIFGKLSYYLHGFINIFKKPNNNFYHAYYDDKNINDSFYQILLLNTKYIAGFKSKNKCDALHLAMIKKRNRFNGFFKFLNYVLFNKKNKKDIHDVINKITIEAENEIEATIDGEKIISKKYEIEVLKNYLEIISR